MAASPAPLDAETWARIGLLFDRLAALPPDQRRIDALDQPQAARTLLERMLAAHDSTDPQLLDRTVRAVAGGLLHASEDETGPVDYNGRAFGPWQALEEVGRGGMAVVLRGRRADGRFEKEVAIKLLPRPGAGMEHERLLDEIRILARLEHPGIAQLIDGGIDEEGTPFLVMEFVRGVPVTDYCRRHRLDTKARIDLLTRTIEPVLFAHRRLVVHCDLKPDNILVTEDGRIKLVDFGIAGLVSAGGQASSVPRGLFCSPTFCAPEQMHGAAPDTAQDVFSLGAVLYQLLSTRRIRDNATAIQMLFDGAAGTRAIAPPSRFRPGLDRDLDAICMKALASAPGDRYVTVDALRSDLENWRARRPVAARAPTRRYRLARFLARNRVAVVAAALVLAIAGAGLAGTLWQAHEARQQAAQALAESQRARATRDFLVQLFQANDPDVAQGRTPSARDLLDQGAYQVRNAFSDAPQLRTEMLLLLGGLYLDIAEFEAASPLMDEALALTEADGSLETRVHALHQRGSLDMELGQHDSALDSLEAAERLLAQAGMIPGRQHGALMQHLIATLSRAGRNREGVDRAEAALTLARADAELPAEALYDYLFAASNVLVDHEQYPRAEALLREAMALNLPAPQPPGTRIGQHSNLAILLRRNGDLEQALAEQRQAVALAEQIYPPLHFRRAQAYNNLASYLSFLGRFDEAAENAQTALDILTTVYPHPRHPRLAATHNNLGMALRDAGRHAEAEPHLVRAHELAADIFGREDARYAIAGMNLGSLLTDLGRHDEAERLLLDSLALRRSSLGPDHPAIGASQTLLAKLRLRQGRTDEALHLADGALDLYRRIGWRNAGHHLPALSVRGRALARLGRTEAAQASFMEALALVEQADSDVGRERPRLLAAHAEFLLEHDPAAAPAAIARALQAHIDAFGEHHPQTQRLSAMQATNSGP